jgi:hypothetical protein
MQQQKRLVVRGRQRKNIDPHLLVQVLLAIGAEWARNEPRTAVGSGIDVLDSAVEDRGVKP